MNINLPVGKTQHPMAIPLDIGVIHLIGIGGIGMSGIAEILNNIGYKVSGSDQSESANVQRLRGMGIEIFIGHDGANVEGKAVVVKSTAVPMTNPEIIAARRLKIPVVRRSEMLAELTRLKATVAVAGTHGKTTTTSIISALFEEAGLDPTVINGGIINSHGTNAILGAGKWLVAEADESDGTFIKIPATIGVITNIDPEHLDYWGDFDALKDAFKAFLDNLPFYGFAVLCNDHPEVQRLIARTMDRRIITYGIETNADICATNIRSDVSGSTFDVSIAERLVGEKLKVIKDIFLPVPGVHNILNALAAVAIAHELKIEDDILAAAFEKFSGVKRRFTKTGEVSGVTIIDDYGHHPTEISATLSAAKSMQSGNGGRVIAVVQPHRYSRLERLFSEFCKCFGDADKVLVTDVFAANEQPIDGVDRDALVSGLRDNGRDAEAIEGFADLVDKVQKSTQAGDMVVFLGAGNITDWAGALPQELLLQKQSA